MKNVYVSLLQHLLRTWSCNNLVRKHQITIFLYNIWSVFNALSVCATWFLIQIPSLLPNMDQMVHTVWTLLGSKYLAPGLLWLKLHEKGKITLGILLSKNSEISELPPWPWVSPWRFKYHQLPQEYLQPNYYRLKQSIHSFRLKFPAY